MTLSADEQRRFIAWVVANVTADAVVPLDEGSTEGLVYNLIQLILGSDKRWASGSGSISHHVEQFQELRDLGFVDEP